MKNCIIYRERNPLEPNPFEMGVLDKILGSKFPDTKFHSASTADTFKNMVKETPHDMIIIDWASASFPTEMIEFYYQSQFCRSPVAIYYSYLSRRDIYFLSEYSIKEAVLVADPKIVDFYQGLIKLVKDLLVPRTKEQKIRKFQIRIHYHLNTDNLDRVTDLFNKVKPHLTSQQVCFYESQFLKKAQKFEEAIERILREPKKDLNLMNLLGSLYYHTKKYVEAIACYDPAIKKSPLNFRRRYLAARCHEELSKVDATHQRSAMAGLLELRQIAPNYGEVTGRIVNIVAAAESIDKIPLVESLLLQLSTKEITKIYKKIGKFSEPFKSSFTDVFITAVSKRANGLIQQDDHTALKFYKYIKKLIPEEAVERHRVVDYCVARAYFRFGQLDLAHDLNQKVLQASNGKYEKSVALGKLIHKALKGEFDVLLDDEKDWLVPKRQEKVG